MPADVKLTEHILSSNYCIKEDVVIRDNMFIHNLRIGLNVVLPILLMAVSSLIMLGSHSAQGQQQQF